MAKANFSDLPPEVQAIIRPHLTQDADMLDSIGRAIAGKRDEAKAARLNNGIEDVWWKSEEAYVCIDDANRHEYPNSRWQKPPVQEGTVEVSGRELRQTARRSTAFVPLTRRYVDAGAAKLGEILIPIDGKAFSIKATPVPDLEKAKDSTDPVFLDQTDEKGQPLPALRDALPSDAPATAPMAAAGSPMAAVPPMPGPAAAGAGAVPPAAAAAPPKVQLTKGELAKEKIAMAEEKASLAEKWVFDQMVESKYGAEMRKVIFDAARIGVGVLKAPFPKATRGIKISKGAGGALEVKIKQAIQPGVKAVDPWNIYPDPACGENIHNGDYIFELDYISERQLRNLKRIPGYIAKSIDRIIAQGPLNSTADRQTQAADGTPSTLDVKNRYAIWYYYGTLQQEELQCIATAGGKPMGDKDLAGKTTMYVIVTMVNDTVIRATINPLDSGEFPYHSVPWQRRPGNWAGIGVAEQMTMPQRTVNAATRALLNNAGNSAGSQIVVNRGAISPADGSWQMTPDKVWNLLADSGLTVEEAFAVHTIPNVTNEMMVIVNYALQLAEEATSIPLVTQGQSGKTTPDTYGATQLQDNNANQLLRSIGYAWDDFITEPVVRQFYEWYLLDPDIADEDKGEFVIDAKGSAALVERAINDQFLANLANIVLNPAFGIDPKKWFEQYAQSKRMKPADLQFTKEQQEEIDKRPPPEAPQVQVANIRAAVEREKIAAEAKDEGEQRALAREELRVGHIEELARLAAHEKLELVKYANIHKISVEKAKAEIARTAMTLETQIKLNAADRAGEQRRENGGGKKVNRQRGPAPIANPPGRANNGQALSQVGS